MIILANKKLNLAEFNKLEKKITTTRDIIVGEEKYPIKIADFIRDTDIDDFMLEFTEIVDELRKDKNINFKTAKNVVYLQPILMLRKFTDAYVPKGNNIEELIKVSNVYADTGIMKEIMDNFDTEQKDKISKRVDLLTKDLGRNMAELSLQLEQQKNDINA